MGLVLKRLFFSCNMLEIHIYIAASCWLACTVKQWGMPADVAVLINALLECVD